MEKENQQNGVKKVEKDTKCKWKIDKEMLPYKVHFFLSFGAFAALLPYHPSIGITRLGLGASNLAVVFTIQQFLYIFFQPLFCYAVDYFKNMKGMIVTLIVINAILSYLFLAIPKVRGSNFIDVSDDSLFMKQPAHIAFCKLCPLSNELNKVVKYLPIITNKFYDEVHCQKESSTLEKFTGYCTSNSNSSVAFNTELEIKIITCYSTKNKLSQSRKIDNNHPLHNESSTLFIKMYHHCRDPEFIIGCSNFKSYFLYNNSNFTIKKIINSCFKYPQKQSTANNTTVEKYPNLSKHVICNNSEMNQSMEVIKYNSFKTYQFWMYTLILIISCTCASAICILSDTACYETIQKTGADYGKQRAWGSVSWGLVAPFAGFLNDYTDDYWSAMIVMSLLCVLQIWNVTKIKLEKPKYSQSILKDIKSVFSSWEFIAFEVGVFLNGIGCGMVWYFLPWFITDIGGSSLLIGLVHTVQCFLGDLPLMCLSGWLIKKIGHFNVVSMALFAYCVRCLAYSSLKDPWWILPIECLHGITFGAFYAAMTSYGKMNAKPGTEATTQALLCSTFKGLGAGVGCVIGGTCLDNFGGCTTFFYLGLCFALATAINIVSTVSLHIRKHFQVLSKETPVDSLRY